MTKAIMNKNYKRVADELAVIIMHLQNALYADVGNTELREAIDNLEEDYQYLRSRYEETLG